MCGAARTLSAPSSAAAISCPPRIPPTRRALSLSTARVRARSKGMWDQSFVATYTVTLKGDRLATNFAVKNTGGAPFSFTGALHSYWSVSSIDGIEIQGAFEGAKYLDKVAGEEKTCATKALKIGAETDAVNGLGSNRETDAVADAQPTLPHSHTAPLLPPPSTVQVYKGVSGDVTIVDAGAGRKLTISSTAGWSDTVVWSPYGDEGMGYARSARAASRVLCPHTSHLAHTAPACSRVARILVAGTTASCASRTRRLWSRWRWRRARRGRAR